MHRPIALGSQDMRKGKEGQYITLVTRRTVETNSKAVGHHPEIRVDIAHFTIWFVRVENLGLRELCLLTMMSGCELTTILISPHPSSRQSLGIGMCQSSAAAGSHKSSSTKQASAAHPEVG